MKPCPYCGEEIQDEATVCPHCKRDLPPATQVAPAAPTATARKRLPAWLLALIGVPVLVVCICVLVVLVRYVGAQAEERREALAATATHEARAAAATATQAARISHISEPFFATVELVHDPTYGELIDEDDDHVEIRCADVTLTDFVAEATFTNPSYGSVDKWDYGFFLRHTGPNEEYRWIITSKGLWYYYLGAAEDYIEKGSVSMATSTGDTNLVRVVARGDTAYLYVNGSLLSQVTLDDRPQAGDVCVATGIFKGYEEEGRSTEFEDFQVWEITE